MESTIGWSRALRRGSFRLSLPLAAAALLTLASVVPAAAAPPDAAAPAVEPAGADTLSLDQILTGYSRPVHLTNTGSDSRIFIVEQGGDIEVAANRDGSWQKLKKFLDLTSLITTAGNEQGLLGLAFHPNYESNGRLYVNYTRAGDGATVIAEFRRSGYASASKSSQRILMVISQPYSNHNGGMLEFGPEGALYIATGDGGSGGDPGNRGQRLDTLLGKILRIKPGDPDGSGPKKYSIPTSNPFVGREGRDQIWSYGLRNPWKFSFDRVTGDIWIADVGQEYWEEVNRRPSGKGENFGWRILEGRHYYPDGGLCTSNCKTMPLFDYRQSDAVCQSVTGGYVYRGTDHPSLVGDYVFADYCSGRVWRIESTHPAGTPMPSPSLDTDLWVSSFGEDRDGELYLVNLNGTIHTVGP